MTFLRAAIAVAILCIAAVTHAGEVEERAARVTTQEAQVRVLDGERRAQEKALADKAAAIAALKAQSSSWGRDRKLQALLAESRELAAQLDRKDQQLRQARAAADAERKLLVAAIDRELAAVPPPDEARVAQLARQRAELVAPAVKPLRLPDDRIAPDDDAADLDYKAAALAQGERSLRAEEQRLVARAGYFRKQAKLARSRLRADEADVFRDDEPRRGTVRSGGTPDRGETGNYDTPTGPATPGSQGNPGSLPPPQPQTQFDSRVVDLAADPTVILADVVAAGTLDELRRAARSGDPESIAAAAEHARLEVQQRAERLRARRLEMEQRARELRGEK